MFDTSRDKGTAEAMADPQVGDRFCEMFSFWVYVVWRNLNRMAYMEASPPCTFPDDAKLTQCTVEEFRKRFAYGSIDGYWVSLVDRGNKVDGWIKESVVVEKANQEAPCQQ